MARDAAHGHARCPPPSAPSQTPSLPDVSSDVKPLSLCCRLCLPPPQAEKPDCTERQQLQRRLGCRTFHWFLANVYPELYPLERRPRFSGKARHEKDKGQRRKRAEWLPQPGPGSPPTPGAQARPSGASLRDGWAVLQPTTGPITLGCVHVLQEARPLGSLA